MKYCENCFTINEDSELVCISCGAPLSSSNNKTPNKDKQRWNLVVILAAVLLILGIGTVIGKTVFSTDVKLEKASKRTLDVFQEQLALQTEETVLKEIVSTLQSPILYTSFGYRNNTHQLQMNTDCSYKDKSLRGTAYYSSFYDDEELELNYSIESNVLQISLPDFFGNVYGCNIKQLSKSKVARILPISIPEDFGKTIFKKTSIQNILKSYGGEHYSDFVKSVKFKKLSDKELSLGGQQERVSAYKVTWSSHAFTEFISNAWGIKIFSAIGQIFNSIIPEVEPDCMLYVNKSGYLVGFDLVSTGKKYLFLLEGTECLWDHFSLCVTSLYADPVVYTGFVNVSDHHLTITLKNEQEIFCTVDYDSSIGEYAIYTAQSGELLQGKISQDNGSVGITMVVFPCSENAQELYFQFEPIASVPQPLSNDYIDLLDMTLTDVQRLLLDMNIRSLLLQ